MIFISVNETLQTGQEGSSENDHIFTASGTADGNVVLAGETAGNFARRAAGYQEAAAVKLDANGTVLWRWQVKTRKIYLAGVLSSAEIP